MFIKRFYEIQKYVVVPSHKFRVVPKKKRFESSGRERLQNAFIQLPQDV